MSHIMLASIGYDLLDESTSYNFTRVHIFWTESPCNIFWSFWEIVGVRSDTFSFDFDNLLHQFLQILLLFLFPNFFRKSKFRVFGKLNFHNHISTAISFITLSWWQVYWLAVKTSWRFGEYLLIEDWNTSIWPVWHKILCEIFCHTGRISHRRSARL